MPRGGKRQGTPGKGYSNRTDLTSDYASGSPAAGGMEPQPQRQQFIPPSIGADQVPSLSDPTMRPDEPITAGLKVGAGAGSEALGPLPPGGNNPVRAAVQALIAISPNNPDLIRLLNKIDAGGF
jgi:hypothetical protein